MKDRVCKPYEIRAEDSEKISDIERRLINRLGKRYISAYRYGVEKLNDELHEYTLKEWWLRVHLLVDHVSGMTDEFALETYQMLEGINLMHK